MLIMAWIEGGRRNLVTVGISMGVSWACFYGLLYQMGLLEAYQFWTSGSTSIEDAIQRGVLDYLRIHPLLLGWTALASALFLPFLRRWRALGWCLYLVGIGLSYVVNIFQQQDFVPPIDQSRVLFWLGMGWLAYWAWQIQGERSWGAERKAWFRLLGLMGLSWMASVSWGYPFPILFALPYTFALLKISQTLQVPSQWKWIALIGLLLLFRFANEYIYRDGPRAQMWHHLGEVFPQLQYIYSSPSTYNLYAELKKHYNSYGPCLKTLPAFPQSNYLTQSPSPIPLDWVIQVEYNSATNLLIKQIDQLEDCTVLLQKKYRDDLQAQGRLEVSHYISKNWRLVDSSQFFLIYRP